MSKITDHLNRAYWLAERIKDEAPHMESQANLLQDELHGLAEQLETSIDEDNDALIGTGEE